MQKNDVIQRFKKPTKGASDMILRFKRDGKSGMILVVWDFAGQKVGSHTMHIVCRLPILPIFDVMMTYCLHMMK